MFDLDSLSRVAERCLIEESKKKLAPWPVWPKIGLLDLVLTSGPGTRLRHAVHLVLGEAAGGAAKLQRLRIQSIQRVLFLAAPRLHMADRMA